MSFFDNSERISAPITKAVAAIGAGAGSTILSSATKATNFLPQDLAGWLGVLATAAALVYSICLLCEWWWKKIWSPILHKRKMFQESKF